jgi:hypothetical protein
MIAPFTKPPIPPRVQAYIEELVRTCGDSGRVLVSIVLFGSSATGGFLANAARALGEIKDRSASSSLIRLLGHEKDGGVIEQTTLALRMLGAKEAVPSLKKVAPHPSTQTRCWVLQAIGTLGGKKDVPFLAKYLYDANETIDMFAAQAIEEITGQDFGFPKQSGPMSPQQGIERARRWWEISKTSFRNLE